MNLSNVAAGGNGAAAPPASTPAPAPAAAPKAPAAAPAKTSPFGGAAPKPAAPAFTARNPRAERAAASEGASNEDFDDLFTDTTPAKPSGSKVASNKAEPVKKPAAEVTDENDIDDFVDGEDTDAGKDKKTPKPDDEVTFKTEEDDADDDSTEDDDAGDPAEGKPAARDYTKYSPEVAKILKKLPNNLYARFADKIDSWEKAAAKLPELQKEVETLAKSAPRYLAEHPQAYQLSPEYSQVSQLYSDASFEASHWSQQLTRIKSGQPWTQITGYDANNNPITVKHPAPTDGKTDVNAEVYVQQILNEAQSKKNLAQQHAQQIAGNARGYYQSAVQELDKTVEQFFKTTPDKLPKEDKEFYDKAYMLIPDAFKSHPLAKVVPMAFPVVRNLATKLQAALAENKKLKATGVAPRTVANRRAGAGGKNNVEGMTDLDALYSYND